MNSQNLMIDDAFDQVEQPPTQDKPANHGFKRGDWLTPISGAPQHHDADQRYDPDKCMKEAIPQHICAHGFHGCGWNPVGNHVVPLEYLMQNDPVYKTAHANTQQNPCACGFPVVRVFRHVGNLQAHSSASRTTSTPLWQR